MSEGFEQQMGAAIRRARHPYGLRPFAERLATFGLTTNYASLARLEKGERSLTVRELLVIAAALDVSPDTLVFPDGDRDPVQLTDELVEDAGTLRSWWAGRNPLLGTRRRAPRPSWPDPDGLDPDRIRERADQWRRQRPLQERRARAVPGVDRLLRAVDRLAATAGHHGKPTAHDRQAIRAELYEVKDACAEIAKVAFEGSDDDRRQQLAAEIAAILLTAADHTEGSDDETRQR